MNLVLFTHPEFLGSQSMPRFAMALAQGYRARGHRVELRAPVARVRQWLATGPWAKWAGYIDQYLLFPQEIRRQLRRDPADTLYVFCDQALGPWVPCVSHRPHVVHCHDLLALRSALGLIAENPTGLTGRIYQRYIRRGFRRARHFISISQRTRADLHQYGGVQALSSEVVYNGLNYAFVPMDAEAADQALQSAGLSPPEGGLLLHVGGGQWYKNAIGVLEMYGAYARRCPRPLPLWMVSPPPGPALQAAVAALPPGAHVQFIGSLSSPVLNATYCKARALLFPSLAEGFGWPIAEALACGCPVITTDEAPMNEVGGPVADYLPRRPPLPGAGPWAEAAGERLIALLARPEAERQAWREQALAWVHRFDADRAITGYLEIYERVLALETRPHAAAAPAVDGVLR